MKRLLLPAFAALALVACSETKKEVPQRQPAPETEQRAPRAAQKPANQPHQLAGNGNEQKNVNFSMGNRTVIFTSLEGRTSMLGVGDNHLTVRVSEYNSQRTMMIGFRNLTSGSYAGTYKAMSGQRSPEPQAVVNVLNCGDPGQKHVTMKEGTVTVKSVNPDTGAISLEFEGTGYALTDHEQTMPIPLKGALDMTMPTVQDQRQK